MSDRSPQWILAFDASCRTCRHISSTIGQACSDRLTVLPLGHESVLRWREEAFASEPPWRPTLLRVAEGQVKAWTGLRLAMRLVGLLRPATTIRVLRALGALRLADQSTDPDPRHTQPASAIGRRRLLQVAFGAAIAGGIVITGRAPAYADPVPGWIARNRVNLPTDYAGLITLPRDYRTAAYQELTPEQKSRAWLIHLDDYRAAHPDLTAEQSKIIDQVVQIAGDVNNFVDGGPPIQAPQLQQHVRDAFGAEASALVATLGPADIPTTDSVLTTCQCAVASDYCSGAPTCHGGGCTRTAGGCGFLYSYDCDGLCR